MYPRAGMRVSHGLLFALLALCVSCGGRQGSALERVKRSGYLRWGGDLQGGAPYVFEDASRPGGITGFEVELAAAIARELGVRPKFVQQDWSNLIPSLERGSFDVALNGIEVTPQRVDRVQMTRPYFIFSAQLVTRRNDPDATSLRALAGHRVGTLASSFSYDVLREVGNVTIVPYEGNEEPYADLEDGRIDGVLLDDIIVARYGTVRPALRVVEDVREGYYSAACRKEERDLCAAIDAALTRISRSGELRRILARWEIDNDEQARLAAWSDADTHAMLSVHDRTTFGFHHFVLFLQGAGVTLLVSTLSMVLAILFGLVLALARMYGSRPLSIASTAYVELFRGTPVLLQLYMLYFGIMPWFRHTFDITRFTELDAGIAAVLGLGMNYAAYEAEIYRAGIQAIPPGQLEAARVLGMHLPLALRRIIVPQAVRVALPGVTNDFIALLKDSSLVSVITVVELTKHMTITAVDVRSWAIPGALCAALYMAMSYPLSRLSQYLEARLERK